MSVTDAMKEMAYTPKTGPGIPSFQTPFIRYLYT